MLDKCPTFALAVDALLWFCVIQELLHTLLLKRSSPRLPITPYQLSAKRHLYWNHLTASDKLYGGLEGVCEGCVALAPWLYHEDGQIVFVEVVTIHVTNANMFIFICHWI